MLHAISYRTSVQCPECLQPVPVNHLRAVMLCSHCEAMVDLVQRGRAWWMSPKSEEATHAILSQLEGDVRSIQSSTFQLEGPSIFTVECFHGPADCPACRRAMTRATLATAASNGTYQCPCGFTCACREAEASLRQKFPQARWLLGEAPPAGAAPDATQPILIACTSCGASLHADGSSRSVACSYCNASNYLPDGLWLRLHPAPHLEWFRLVIEFDEALVAEARSRDQSDAFVRLAAKKGADPELLVQEIAKQFNITTDEVHRRLRSGEFKVDL